MKKYGVKTIQDFVDEVMNNKENFPKGMETVIMTGDFASNNTHEKHELAWIETEKYGKVCVLCYKPDEEFNDIDK